MRKLLIYFTALGTLVPAIWSCNSGNSAEEETGETVILSGQVINESNYVPLSNAVVRILNFTPEQATITDANGSFSLEFVLDSTTTFEIVAFKETYEPDTITAIAVPGRTIDGLQFKLAGSSGSAVASGEAASVVLFEISSQTIGVHESGSTEVAEVVFEVQDSSGLPIDFDHSVDVNFYLGSAPGGGEFLYPTSGTTTSYGTVSTNIFSGITAGVVQIIAEVDQGGVTLRSKPVAVTIHGGLPDASHFSLAVKSLNFPGYNIYGLLDGITAYVGDKYGNPVKSETSVYFTTTGGIIAGSAVTDEMGRASVDLMSAAPKPDHAVYGPGFATVTGRTADEDQNTIEAYTLVLFSGIPQISINTTSIDVPNDGSQSINFTVSDQNNNPLAAGTTISVGVEAGDVKAVGNTDINIPDTQSRGWTNFSFTLIDSKPDETIQNPVTIKITTSGPNGAAEAFVSGIAR
jgi:hypothetical protein